MLYESDLQSLLSQWQERLSSQPTGSSYRDALSDCMYDLQSLIDSTTVSEIEALNPLDYLPPDELLDTWLSQEADSALASMKDYGTA